MKIKSITQVSFLALMLGMTGSLSSLGLAQAVEEDAAKGGDVSHGLNVGPHKASEVQSSGEAEKPKSTVTADKSGSSVIMSENKIPAIAFQHYRHYHPVAFGKTITVYTNNKGDIVESRHLGDSTSLKVTEPAIAKAAVDSLNSSDVKKVKTVVEVSPTAPAVKQVLANYAYKNGLHSTTDGNGVLYISAKGSAAKQLITKAAAVVPSSSDSDTVPSGARFGSSLFPMQNDSGTTFPSSGQGESGGSTFSHNHSGNAALLSGNRLNTITATATLSGSNSGNRTRTNTATFSGSNSGNRTQTLSGSSGNVTRTNTDTATLSGSNSANNTQVRLSSVNTDSGNSETSNTVSGNTISKTATNNSGGNTATLTNSGGNTTSTTSGGNITGNGNMNVTGNGNTISPITINVTQLPLNYYNGGGYGYNGGGYGYNGGGYGYNGGGYGYNGGDYYGGGNGGFSGSSLYPRHPAEAPPPPAYYQQLQYQYQSQSQSDQPYTQSSQIDDYLQSIYPEN